MKRREFFKAAVSAFAIAAMIGAPLPALAQWNGCSAGICDQSIGQPPWDGVTLDPAVNTVTGNNVQSISLNMTVTSDMTVMLIATHYSYLGHANFTITWTVGATTQTFVAGSGTNNFDFILTSDNSGTASSISLVGLINPTVGTGTLTLSFTTSGDYMVMRVMNFIGANNLGGVSGAFPAAGYAAGTGTSTSFSLPPLPLGLQFCCASAVTSSPTTWNAGTQLYSTTPGTLTWGSGTYQHADAAQTFSLGIAASANWATAGVCVAYKRVFAASPTLNTSNAFYSRLAAAIPCLGAGTLTDLVTSKTASTAGGITTDTTGGWGGGIAVPANSTTAKADFGVWQPSGTGDFTIVCLMNPGTTNFGCPIGQCDSVAANFIDFLINGNHTTGTDPGKMSGGTFNGSNAQGVDDGPGAIVTNGTMHVAKINGGYHTWAFRVASGVPSLYCDGQDVSTTIANVTGSLTNVSQHFAIGNLGNFTTQAFSAGCTIVNVLVLATGLSNTEMKTISGDCMQVYA